MSATPFYKPADVQDIFYAMLTIEDSISALFPLPYGQFATDNHTNLEISDRHRELKADAAKVRRKLYTLVGEILERDGQPADLAMPANGGK